jgi:hypothetical protein
MNMLFIHDALPTRSIGRWGAADIKPAERTRVAPQEPPLMSGPSRNSPRPPVEPAVRREGGSAGGSAILIEDIAGMRRRNGIDDDDLRDDIRRLAVGDLVRLTLRAEQAAAGETVVVRITEVRSAGFRGALAGRPASKSLAGLGIGFALGFTAEHIHSVPNRPAGRGR